MSLWNRLSVKAKVALVVSVAVLIYLSLLCVILGPSNPVNVRQFNPSEKAAIEKKFKYHGIEGAECTNNVCWFYRNGKKCKL